MLGRPATRQSPWALTAYLRPGERLGTSGARRRVPSPSRGYCTAMLRDDQALKLIRDGYRWSSSVRAGSTAVAIRFLGRRAVVVGGPEGVRRFYDPRLRRRGAIP